MSLRRRFVVASSAVLLAVSSGAFSLVWVAYNAGQERQLDAILLSEAEGDALNASHSTGGTLALRGGEPWPIVKYAALYDNGGEPRAWTTNMARARPLLDLVRHTSRVPFDFWWNNEHLRAVLVPVSGPGSLSLLLATPRTDIDGDARDLARTMLEAVLIATAVSAGVTAWLARMLTREHERIAGVARAVAAGDLSARVGSASTDPEIARLARDIDEMISRLSLLVERQQLFIANAAHELRTPIGAVLGELSLAIHRERDAASYRASIDEALASARSLKVVTEDLLALARIGATNVAFDTVLIGDVIRAAVVSASDEAEAKQVKVEVAADNREVHGHKGDLTRLMRNLIENAIRHTPGGGVVRIEARALGDQAIVEVSDDGPGVPADVRERVFEPFVRLSNDGADRSGAGLGLAIARGIARAHGGDLAAVDSDRGARFVVRLPLLGSPTRV
jgi:two-component system, OmpR family, sensor kinase